MRIWLHTVVHLVQSWESESQQFLLVLIWTNYSNFFLKNHWIRFPISLFHHSLGLLISNTIQNSWKVLGSDVYVTLQTPQQWAFIVFSNHVRILFFTENFVSILSMYWQVILVWCSMKMLKQRLMSMEIPRCAHLQCRRHHLILTHNFYSIHAGLLYSFWRSLKATFFDFSKRKCLKVCSHSQWSPNYDMILYVI